MDFILSLQDKS